MSKLLSLNNFAKSGINTDLISWELPGEFLTEIKNLRIKNKKLSPFGGYSIWASMPVNFDPGYIMHAGLTSGRFWMLPGETQVYVYDGTTFSDVSNTAGYPSIADVGPWTGCMLSDIAIITNPGHYPEYWPSQSGAVTMLYLPWDSTQTWLAAGERCSIIRCHKQYLFAMGINSSGTDIPDAVRWSSPADVGGLPATWDPLDTTNVAGIVNLGGTGGNIIDGLSLRDAFVVYREKGINIFDYAGGVFVWQIRQLSADVGLISPECIVEVKGVHYFIGDGDILVNDGNSIQSLLHNKVRNRFIDNYDADNFKNSYVLKSSVDSEIWFCIPENGNVNPNVAYIYNWKDDSISIRNLPDCSFATQGAKQDAALTWDTATATWDTVDSSWAGNQSSPLNESVTGIISPAGAGLQGSLVELDPEVSDIQFDTTIERVSFALEGLNNTTTIQRIYPRLSGDAIISIQVGSQEYPGSPINWKPVILFNPKTDRKVDIRSTGELHSFKIFTENSSKLWSFSGMDIEYVNAGVR